MTIDVDALRAEHESVFGESACPQWAIDSLTAYSIAGIPPGDCLMAFLENDLMGACQRADIETGRRIAAIAGYIYNHVPSVAHGSYELVQEWITMHRARRIAEQ